MVTPIADIKTKIGANFPIEEEIIIEVIDSSGGRIYSGKDSKLVSIGIGDFSRVVVEGKGYGVNTTFNNISVLWWRSVL